MPRRAALARPSDATLVINNGAPTERAKFQRSFNDFLARMDGLKVHTAARDLTKRIELGEEKTAKALKAAGYPMEGDAKPDGKLGEALALPGNPARRARGALPRVDHSSLRPTFDLADSRSGRRQALADQG